MVWLWFRHGELDEMTEAAEIAINIAIWLPRKNLPSTFDEALRLVRRVAPDLGSQMADNVAEELMRRGPYA